MGRTDKVEKKRGERGRKGGDRVERKMKMESCVCASLEMRACRYSMFTVADEFLLLSHGSQTAGDVIHRNLYIYA